MHAIQVPALMERVKMLTMKARDTQAEIAKHEAAIAQYEKEYFALIDLIGVYGYKYDPVLCEFSMKSIPEAMDSVPPDVQPYLGPQTT